jgi:hypothetical protein
MFQPPNPETVDPRSNSRHFERDGVIGELLANAHFRADSAVIARRL